MAKSTGVNSTSPNTIQWAGADSDPFERSTDVAGVAENFDLHDHSATKNLGVKRVQTSAIPGVAGEVRVNADDLQWFGTALQTGVRLTGTQTLSGDKTFSGTTTFTGQLTPAIGVGVAAIPGAGVYVAPATLSGTTEYGTLTTPTFQSGTTVAGYAQFARLQTQATAFTMTNGYGLYVDTPVKGAGSVITTLAGLHVAAQTQGGTSNYGVRIAQPSGGATVNLPLYVEGGMIALGVQTNAFMTHGLLISQAGADNEILSLKSSDVAHGITGIAESDTFGNFQKVLSTTGGLAVTGLSSGTLGLWAMGIHTTDSTLKNTSASAALALDGRLRSGTTTTSLGATGNILVVQNAGSTRFIFQSDGTLFQNGRVYPGTDAGAFQTASGIFAGTGVPNNANGNNGDFYFRSDGGAATCLYQRRAGAWVATGA